MKPSNTVLVSSEYVKTKEEQIRNLQEKLADSIKLNEQMLNDIQNEGMYSYEYEQKLENLKGLIKND